VVIVVVEILVVTTVLEVFVTRVVFNAKVVGLVVGLIVEDVVEDVVKVVKATFFVIVFKAAVMRGNLPFLKFLNECKKMISKNLL
jgi:hypothetical protein